MKMKWMLVALTGLMVACGGAVQQEESAPTSVQEALVLGGEQCGANVCGAGAYCCNPSCGTCAPNGGGCLDVMCGDASTVAGDEAKPAPSAEAAISTGGPCGTNYCGKGYFCCNPGCGVCAPEGGGCPDVMCDY